MTSFDTSAESTKGGRNPQKNQTSTLIMAALFIASVICGTSTDFILRQGFPDGAVFINIAALSFAGLALFLFLKTIRSFSVPDHMSAMVHPPRPRQEVDLLASFTVNDPFLVIRFFAAALVFVSHMALLLKPSGAVMHGSLGIWHGAAHQGMAIFFTLSGYLMCKAFATGRYSLTKDGILDFYKSRWIRIFPLQLFVLFFLGMLQYPALFREDPLSVWRVLTFNYYGNTIGLNGIGDMWSLTVEFQYYIIAPFIFILFHMLYAHNKIKAHLTLIAIIIALIVTKYVFDKLAFKGMTLYNPMLFSLLGNLPFFLIGFLSTFIKVQPNEKVAKIVFNDMFVIAMFFILYLVCEKTHNFTMTAIVTGLIAASLDSLKRTPAYRNRRRSFNIISILQFLGVVSYGFYLWHSGIGFVYSRLFPEGFSDAASYAREVAYVALVSLVTALVTYVFVEFPLNKYKPRHN